MKLPSGEYHQILVHIGSGNGQTITWTNVDQWIYGSTHQRKMSFYVELTGVCCWISINSLAPGRCGCNFKSIIFKLVMQNCQLGTHCELPSIHATKPPFLRNQQIGFVTWASVDPDLCCQMVSLGHNELTQDLANLPLEFQGWFAYLWLTN